MYFNHKLKEEKFQWQKLNLNVTSRTLTSAQSATLTTVSYTHLDVYKRQNQNIPQDLGYVDRTNSENEFALEIDFIVKKKQLGQIIDRCVRRHGTAITAEMLDKIKALGFKYSTKSAITVAVCDAAIPPQKKQYLAEADAAVEEITDQFNMGLISNEERYKLILQTWSDTTDKVTDALQDNMDQYNPIYMMADSGARGSINQIRQLDVYKRQG